MESDILHQNPLNVIKNVHEIMPKPPTPPSPPFNLWPSTRRPCVAVVFVEY